MKLAFRGIVLFFLGASHALAQGTYTLQPPIEARAVNLLHEKQALFKDLNKNQRLDIYEDWRQPLDKRIADLLSQMTLEEKVGMLLINTLNAGEQGKMTEGAVDLI